jgi:deoxycytidine triphosphate deaminase
MSIKSDKWIRRMAGEHRMIEPFEPGQVREVDGKKIVSYGTSSYGYDIRASSEFKIFTNIKLDHRRSQASTQSVRRHGRRYHPRWFRTRPLLRSSFRIHSNVLTVCLGKSTYARCWDHRERDPFQPEWEVRDARVLPPRAPDQDLPTSRPVAPLPSPTRSARPLTRIPGASTGAVGRHAARSKRFSRYPKIRR